MCAKHLWDDVGFGQEATCKQNKKISFCAEIPNKSNLTCWFEARFLLFVEKQ